MASIVTQVPPDAQPMDSVAISVALTSLRHPLSMFVLQPGRDRRLMLRAPAHGQRVPLDGARGAWLVDGKAVEVRRGQVTTLVWSHREEDARRAVAERVRQAMGLARASRAMDQLLRGRMVAG